MKVIFDQNTDLFNNFPIVYKCLLESPPKWVIPARLKFQKFVQGFDFTVMIFCSDEECF